jgi:hypothetical protein
MFVVRGALALVPPLALRLPIKKWAAVASVFAAGAYTLLAAAPVPSQRSFLMIAIVLLAMLVDRQGLSMRLLAFAALVVCSAEAMLGRLPDVVRRGAGADVRLRFVRALAGGGSPPGRRALVYRRRVLRR